MQRMCEVARYTQLVMGTRHCRTEVKYNHGRGCETRDHSCSTLTSHVSECQTARGSRCVLVHLAFSFCPVRLGVRLADTETQDDWRHCVLLGTARSSTVQIGYAVRQ